MRRKIHFLSLIIGLLLYIFDLGSDNYVAVQYYKHDEQWWFSFTMILIIVPMTIIGNFIASMQSAPETDFGRKMCMFLSCSSIFSRYVEAFKQWNGGDWKNSLQFSHYQSDEVNLMYKLAWLRHIETVTESAPRWCLQRYIMLRQWHFPWCIVVSTLFSLLSLAWSITTLEKVRAIKRRCSFKLTSTVVFLIWQLSDLVARLFAIVIFVFAFRYHVFTFLTIHWVVVFGALVFVEREEFCQENGERPCFPRLLELWLESFPFLLHVTETHIYMQVRHQKRYNFAMSGILGLENILMLIFTLSVSNSGVFHMEVLKPIAISFVVGGMVLGAVFHAIYYYRYYPTENIEIENDDWPVPSIENMDVETDLSNDIPVAVTPMDNRGFE